MTDSPGRRPVDHLEPRKLAARAIDQFVGSRLSKRRTEVGIAVGVLAQALSVSPQLIESYECGEARMEPHHMIEIGYMLSIEPSFFFEGFE